jgi:hypothetical protein
MINVGRLGGSPSSAPNGTARRWLAVDHGVVAASYEEHLRARFPERLRDEDPSGVEATILDADLSGLVETWLHGGRIGPAERSVVRACLQDLDRLLPGLTDPHERHYVGRLRALAELLAEAGG